MGLVRCPYISGIFAVSNTRRAESTTNGSAAVKNGDSIFSSSGVTGRKLHTGNMVHNYRCYKSAPRAYSCQRQ